MVITLSAATVLWGDENDTRLEIRARDGGFDVRILHSDPGDPHAQSTTLCAVKNEADWRLVIDSINHSEEYFNGEGQCQFDEVDFSLPSRFDVRGTRTEALDLIACSLAGPLFSLLASALCRALDSQLQELSASAGGLTSRSLLRRLARVLQVLEESGLCCDDLGKIIEKLHSKPITTQRIWEGVRLLAARAKAQRELDEAELRWALFPLSPDIISVVAEWRRRNPATSAVVNLARGMQASDLHAFLKNYVREHGRMPTGHHTIPRADSTHSGGFVVDFDELNRREDE